MSAMPGSIDTKLWREEPNLFATLAWILEFLDCIWTLYDTLFICINCGVKTIKVSLYVSLYFTLFDTSSQNMELALDLGALRLRCCPMHRSMELRSELREVTATVAGHGLHHGHPKKRLKNCRPGMATLLDATILGSSPFQHTRSSMRMPSPNLGTTKLVKIRINWINCISRVLSRWYTLPGACSSNTYKDSGIS